LAKNSLFDVKVKEDGQVLVELVRLFLLDDATDLTLLGDFSLLVLLLEDALVSRISHEGSLFFSVNLSLLVLELPLLFLE
jgi:hypothetical protein